jgi:hypothetical protein
VLLVLLVLAALAPESPDATGPLLGCGKAPARSWTAVRDHRKALAFVAAVKAAAIVLSEGGPFDCGLTVVARCGPDLDGDGRTDLIVRPRWVQRYANDGEDDSPALESARCHNPRFKGPNTPFSSLFALLSAGAGSSLGKAVLLADETGSGREGPTVIAFTEWRGQPALKLDVRFMHSDTGITDHKERIVVVQDGRPVTVSERPLTSTP